MPMQAGGSWRGALAQVLLLALLQLPSASAPLGLFCATEERGCFRDCYDPAKKQCALHVVGCLADPPRCLFSCTDPGYGLPLIRVHQTGDRPACCTHRAHATLWRRRHQWLLPHQH